MSDTGIKVYITKITKAPALHVRWHHYQSILSKQNTKQEHVVDSLFNPIPEMPLFLPHPHCPLVYK